MANTNSPAALLAALSPSQAAALYSMAYEGGSDWASILGCTGLVGLVDYKLTINAKGREVAALMG